jgi:endonuclease/exonuclease/phosphatase family metal-dependent hydrolase
MEGGVSGTSKARVLTLNLWGRQGAWDERRSVLVDGLEGLRPDLVAFQEAIVRDGYDQVSDLLGEGYHVVHQGLGLLGDGNHGASVASRWPLGEVREVDLHLTERTEDYPCAALVAEVLAPEPLGPLLFVSYGPSHQLSVELERELQAVATATLVEELVGEHNRHVVLAGDFNADAEAASVRFWSGRQSLDGASVCYRDAWEETHPDEPGHTFTPRNPLVRENKAALRWGRRMDYLFVRCGDALYGPSLDITSCERIFEEPVDGVWASDHFGVVADLTARGSGRQPDQ